jgi:hypothetical protein
MPSREAALLCQLRRLTYTLPGDAELLRRWAERSDENAFTAPVSRHGRMVHGTCRRVLGNTHDAEDAFQAVFLVLGGSPFNSTERTSHRLTCQPPWRERSLPE